MVARDRHVVHRAVRVETVAAAAETAVRVPPDLVGGIRVHVRGDAPAVGERRAVRVGQRHVVGAVHLRSTTVDADGVARVGAPVRGALREGNALVRVAVVVGDQVRLDAGGAVGAAVTRGVGGDLGRRHGGRGVRLQGGDVDLDRRDLTVDGRGGVLDVHDVRRHGLLVVGDSPAGVRVSGPGEGEEQRGRDGQLLRDGPVHGLTPQSFVLVLLLETSSSASGT